VTLGPLHFNRDAAWRLYESWQRCDACLTYAYRATGKRDGTGERQCFRSQACSCGSVKIDGPEPEPPERPWENEQDAEG